MAKRAAKTVGNRAVTIGNGAGQGYREAEDWAGNRPESEIPHQVYAALGQYIADANPYSQRRVNAEGRPEPYPDPSTVRFMLSQTEKEAYHGREWEFSGQMRRVSKALRIAYCVRDKDGQIMTKHILVGFEGANGW